MPAAKLTKQIYQDIAASRDLQWWGNMYPIEDWDAPPDDVELPPNGEMKTFWRCAVCGRIHHKSYRAVKNNTRGCRHSASDTHQPDAYHALAAQWGMEWLPGRYTPQNTKTPQQWRVIATGEVITAAYNEIARKMRNSVKKALGLPYRIRGGKAESHAR